MSEGGTKQARLDRLVEALDEEQDNWSSLGINLEMMRYTGTNVFELDAKVQALINCILKGATDEIDFNIELKTVLIDSLREIRQSVEPQIREAKLAQLRESIVPPMQMPWDRPNGNK